MDPKRWTKTVTVFTGKPGKMRVIASTAEGGEFLLNRWPVEQGPLHMRARVACLEVLEGKMPPEHARAAFIAAAVEADILVKG